MAMDTSKINVAQQQADIAKLSRDLALTKNQLQDQINKSNRLQADNDDLSQKLLVRAKRQGESSVLIDRLTDLRGQLRLVERARDNALFDATELRLVVEQYVEQIQEISLGKEKGVDAIEAINKELELVRQQARDDVEKLQRELEEQVAQAKNVTIDRDHVLELEMLRQETDVLTQTLHDRQQELHASQQTCQLLEDELEDSHTKIDELRRQIEKQSHEINQAKVLVNDAVNPVVEIIASTGNDEMGIGQSVPKLLRAGTDERFFSKKGLVAILFGIILMIGIFELLSVLSGQGEVFRLLLKPSSIHAPINVGNALEQSVDISSGQILRK